MLWFIPDYGTGSDEAELKCRSVIEKRLDRRTRVTVRGYSTVQRQVHGLLAIAALHRRYRARCVVYYDHRCVWLFRVVGYPVRILLEQVFILTDFTME